MVSAKQGNNKRRSRQNNKRFKTGGNSNIGLINGYSGGGGRFNTRSSINAMAMFSGSQIPDNPGYVDFNEPCLPPVVPPAAPQNKKSNNKNNSGSNKRENLGGLGGGQKSRNQEGKSWPRRNKRIPPLQPAIAMPPLPLPPGNHRNFRNPPIPRLGGRPMPPPPLPMAMRPPIPPPAGRFGLRSMVPPPLVGVPMPPPLLPPRGPPMRGARMLPLPPPLISRGALYHHQDQFVEEKIFKQIEEMM